MGDENTRHIIITSENKRNDMGALNYTADTTRAGSLLSHFLLMNGNEKKKKTKNKKNNLKDFFLRGNE